MSDTFMYFAYGSNMLSKRLRDNKRAPSATFVATGYIEGRRLVFDKVSKDGSGKCDIESTGNPGDRVFGVVYRINESERLALDTAEGCGNGYDRDKIEVISATGNLLVVVYVATEKDPALRPYHWYKALVIAGAVEHCLPYAYIEWLRTVDSIIDTNIKRRSKEEKVLFCL